MNVLTVMDPMNYARGMFNTARNVSRVAKKHDGAAAKQHVNGPTVPLMIIKAQ
jgi:hypothetical protein